VEEGNATADVERQRMDVVVIKRAMQRPPRGILICSLGEVNCLHISLSSCWMRAMHRVYPRPGFSLLSRIHHVTATDLIVSCNTGSSQALFSSELQHCGVRRRILNTSGPAAGSDS